MRRAALMGIVLAGSLAGSLAGFASPVLAQAPAASRGPVPEPDMRQLVEATRDVAKAMRENTEYARAVPDILTQILAKLDKIENKLDKVENAVKANSGRTGARR